ncbi:MAG: hypothetical protein DRJ49_05695 [Thermoprotei archaeon]|nr:MAG: hypothetical protein DRJ49_05695 [Thermoprotei archaeon]
MRRHIVVDPTTGKIKGFINIVNSEKCFKALSHPLRLRILKILLRQIMYPRQLARELNISQQLVNYHVKILREAGLVEEVKRIRIRGRLTRLIKLSSEGFAVLLKAREEQVSTIEKLPKFLIEMIGGGERVVLVLSNPEPHGKFMCRGKDHHMIVETIFKLGFFSSRSNLLSVKLDTKVTEEDLRSSNVILLGNPIVNTITYRINEELPIRFDLERGSIIVSLLSHRTYTEEENGVIEVLPNPFNKDLSLLVIAGKGIRGTAAAIIALNKYPDKVASGNKYDSDVVAHVVEGVDVDCDNMIDDVVILE